MKCQSVRILLLAACFGASAAMADPVTVSGPGFTTTSQGQAILDLLGGKVAAAAVTTPTLFDAVMFAHETAFVDHHRILSVPANLRFHPLPKGNGCAKAAPASNPCASALVTLGNPTADVAALLERQ